MPSRPLASKAIRLWLRNGHPWGYCGAPVVLANGARVGSLSVIDFEPRHFDERPQRAVQRLADTASELLQSREQTNQLAKTKDQLPRIFDTMLEGVISLEPVPDGPGCAAGL